MANVLSDTALTDALATLAGWTYDPAGKSIHREFKFKDFSQAFAFMTRVALFAEKADHHPDWSNVYNKVSLTLSTHSAGGVTDKDIAFAQAIGKLI